MGRLFKYFISLILLTNIYAQPVPTAIAVLDFSSAGVPETAAQTLANVVRKELIKSKSYTVVERNLMDDILAEQGLQQSGCATTECAVEVGRLLGVEKIMSGSISKLGELFIVDLQITDVATGEIVALESIDYVGKLEELPQPVRQLTLQVATGVDNDNRETILFVTSIPVGAKVFLDEQFAGNTPLKLVTDLEKVNIRVSQNGFSNWTQSLAINENQTNIVEANLVPVPSGNGNLGLGQLTINCDQPEREIYIDQGLAGKTPFSDPLHLIPGTHEISFFSPEYTDRINKEHSAALQRETACATSCLLPLVFGNSVQVLKYDMKAIETGTKKIFIQGNDELTVQLNWSEIEEIKTKKSKYIKRRRIAATIIALIAIVKLADNAFN